MPVLTDIAEVLTRKMPDVISPGNRSVIDYLVGGTLLAAGAVFWKRNRTAAMAALGCGGAEILANVLTDYSGQDSKLFSMRTRQKVDLALAAMMAALPQSLDDPSHRSFFLGNAIVLTSIANLTQSGRPDFKPKKRPQRVA